MSTGRLLPCVSLEVWHEFPKEVSLTQVSRALYNPVHSTGMGFTPRLARSPLEMELTFAQRALYHWVRSGENDSLGSFVLSVSMLSRSLLSPLANLTMKMHIRLGYQLVCPLCRSELGKLDAYRSQAVIRPLPLEILMAYEPFCYLVPWGVTDTAIAYF